MKSYLRVCMCCRYIKHIRHQRANFAKHMRNLHVLLPFHPSTKSSKRSSAYLQGFHIATFYLHRFPTLLSHRANPTRGKNLKLPEFTPKYIFISRDMRVSFEIFVIFFVSAQHMRKINSSTRISYCV